jgi:diguanylate cyclase (GGDEF)-like protein/PAS domain S-box-containing protein
LTIEQFSLTLLGLLCGALLLLFVGSAGQLRSARRALDQARTARERIERQSYYNNLVVDSANDGLVVQTLDGLVLWANPAYFAMHGQAPENIIGRNPLSYCMPLEDTPTPEVIAAFRYVPDDPNFSPLYMRKNRRGDGSLFWNQMSVSFRTAPDGQEHAIVVCRDVTEQVENEEKLRQTTADLLFSATHDALTRIPNRGALVTGCAAQLEQASLLGTRVGMLQLDIDFFKEINDTHGHGAGDATLVHVARMMQSVAGPRDLVARMGGDEFVMVCPDVQGLPQLQDIGARLAKVIETPFTWGQRPLSCRVSIGAALSLPGAREPEELIQHSDFALYEVKRSGRGRIAAYDEVLHQRYLQLTQRSAELTDAVRNGRIEFYHRPAVIWATQQLLGFETLVRWRHPVEGVLSPSAFLPLAAELGLMPEIDLAAMRAGIDLKLRLRAAGMPNKIVSFNASAEGLLHPDYAPQLKALCTQHDIPPAQLTIEVLETIMFDDQMSASRHAEVIASLRQHGFLTVLDDFGVGHAGLAHLAQLHLSGIKIHRSLVANLTTDKASSRIVATMIDLCADLGLDVMAEGAETLDTATTLSGMGCQIIQGAVVSRPLPAAEALSWTERFYRDKAAAPAARQIPA